MSVAAIIAMAVSTDGRREIVGLHIGPSEAEPFWASFLKDLVRRGLKGVKLVISDAHEGLKAAIRRVIGATWQRCRVHFARNALAYVPRGQHAMVAAAIRQAFIQPDRRSAGETWRHVADQLRGRWPKLGALMDEAEDDVLAYMTFPSQHRVKLHSTDVFDKSLPASMLSSLRAGDLVAKSGVSAGSAAGQPMEILPGGGVRAPCGPQAWPAAGARSRGAGAGGRPGLLRVRCFVRSAAWSDSWADAVARWPRTARSPFRPVRRSAPPDRAAP